MGWVGFRTRAQASVPAKKPRPADFGKPDGTDRIEIDGIYMTGNQLE